MPTRRREQSASLFIDWGESASAGPSSPIGDYDLQDQFIDDGQLVQETPLVSPPSGGDGSPPCGQGERHATREPDVPAHSGSAEEDPEFLAPVGGRRGRPGSFRLKARRIFVTHSQVPESFAIQSFIDDLELLGAQYNIGRERHEDGGTHYHSYIDFGRAFETENPRRFDVGQTHAHIRRVCRTPWNAYNYATKDGDVVKSTCDRPPIVRSALERNADGLYVLAAPDSAELYERLTEVNPWLILKCSTQLEHHCKRVYRPPAKAAYVNPDGLQFQWRSFPEAGKWILGSLSNGEQRIRDITLADPVPDSVIDDWRASMPRQLAHGRRKSLLVWGESQFGKTDFARSLGPHFYFGGDCNIEDLLELDPPSLDYGVLDDMDWTDSILKGNKYKSWLGCQSDFTTTDKFMRKKKIEWGKPCIKLSNDDPLSGASHVDHEWLNKNCTIVYIGSSFIMKRPDVFV